MQKDKAKLKIGWHEWCSLPKFDIPFIKAKIDTGAKTSSLHAFNIKKFTKHGGHYVRFSIHPVQGNNVISYVKEAEIIDERLVMSSNGHNEKRVVIATELQLGCKNWQIEITLSNRDPLRFRMLLGREALGKNVIIYPDKNCLLGKVSKKKLLNYYQDQYYQDILIQR